MQTDLLLIPVSQKHTNRHSAGFASHRQTVRVTAYWFVREIGISYNLDYESKTAIFPKNPVLVDTKWMIRYSSKNETRRLLQHF
jgi:hypothetical protein